jgi:hypothetical protein
MTNETSTLEKEAKAVLAPTTRLHDLENRVAVLETKLSTLSDYHWGASRSHSVTVTMLKELTELFIDHDEARLKALRKHFEKVR